MRRTAIPVLAALSVILGAAVGFFVARDRWRRDAEATPIARGRAVAAAAGCFGCHGPGGVAPIPNPGARGEEVPGWGGGTWMMWNETESDVRAWIEKGRPPGRERDAGALLAMPAYEGVLTRDEIDDVVAFVLAVAQFGAIEDAAASEGRDVATRLGCLGCHGPEGRGLVSNPGSLKGYIPSWDGDDYAELVRGREEFDGWVLNGIPKRLEADPVARWLVRNQTIRMPAYRDRISDGELDALYAYVGWVRAHPRGRP